MSNLFPALAGSAIGAASKTTSSQMQTRLLEQSKTLTESTLQVRVQRSNFKGHMYMYILLCMSVYSWILVYKHVVCEFLLFTIFYLSLSLSLSLSPSLPPPHTSHMQLVYASKDAAGNPKSTAAHGEVDQASKLMQEAVSDLTELLEKAGGEAGLISGVRKKEGGKEGEREGGKGGREKERKGRRERVGREGRRCKEEGSKGERGKGEGRRERGRKKNI